MSLLQRHLRARDLESSRPAIMRWVKVVLVWQLLVMSAAAVYVAVLAPKHLRGAAWVMPALGAVFGSALPLQVVVMAVLRAVRR